MTPSAITPAVSSLNALNAPDPEAQKRTQSSRDFEALLIGQMLHSVRDEDSGWLGSGGDDSSDAAFGLGEEQLAQAIAGGGGFGLGKFIDSALEREDP
jgi:Rod binding domain-containing protein